MYGYLNLPRNPCLTEYSEEFHIESPGRSAFFARAAKFLEEGRSVWIGGPAGSGRESMVRRLAGVFGPKSGRSCALVERGPLMVMVARTLGCYDIRKDRIETAEAVYEKLLEGFRQGGGHCLLFFASVSLDEADREELSILLGLKTLGRPLVAVALYGEGDAPVEALETLSLSLPTSEELTSVLRGRLALCGVPGRYDEAAAQAVMGAKGYTYALLALRFVLNSLGFAPPQEEEAAAPTEQSGRELFSTRDVEEVGWLLDAISRKY